MLRVYEFRKIIFQTKHVKQEFGHKKKKKKRKPIFFMKNGKEQIIWENFKFQTIKYQKKYK